MYEMNEWQLLTVNIFLLNVVLVHFLFLFFIRCARFKAAVHFICLPVALTTRSSRLVLCAFSASPFLFFASSVSVVVVSVLFASVAMSVKAAEPGSVAPTPSLMPPSDTEP